MTDQPSTHPTPRPLKQIIIAGIILLVGIAGFMLMMASRPVAPAKPISERSWTVNVMQVQPQPLSPSLQIYGQATTPINTQLSASISAYVDQLMTSEGNAVSQGQLLIKLNPQDAELTFRQRQGERDAVLAQIEAEKVRHQANLEALMQEQELVKLAKKSVERYHSLKGKNLSSELQLEQAEQSYQQQQLSLISRKAEIADHPNRLAQLQAQLTQVEASLDSIKLDLDRTQIRAPFNGKVSSIDVAPGERVTPGTALISLYETRSLEVKAQIPSRYLPIIRQSLAQSKPVQATASNAGHSINLTLNRLAARIEQGQGGVFGFFSLQDNQAEMELGRSLELQLNLPPVENAIPIPSQSLYGTNRVYKIVEGRLEAVTVERLGEYHHGGQSFLLIASPALQTGEQIITTQLPTAVSGLKVAITGPES